MSYLILAQSEVTARALGAWLELLGEEPLEDAGKRLKDRRVMLAREMTGYPGGFVRCFKQVAAGLARELDGCAAGEAVVLVDSIRPAGLNAVGSADGWDRLVCLLILAFPEVRWAFGVSSGEKPPWWEARHGLASLFGPHFDPLFDGTGLRAHVRGLTRNERNRQTGKPVAPWIPLRTEWSAAIDDEAVYAYLHAYTAYRHGFRAFAVHSQSLADQLFKSDDGPWKLGVPHLTLEDYYLGFPDKDSDKHFAALPLRSDPDHWPLLERVPLRHFITSGHGRSQGMENVRANREFRAGLQSANRGGREATKPIPGIFALWQELRLDRTLFDRDELRRPRRGLAPGFFWPPHDHDEDPSEEGGGHSAPGLLLMVAEHLIVRAEAMVDSVHNVKDAVRGAVLAVSALELLGPKTPTTARDALELKHRFEVMAECQFGGVQYNLQLDERFAEIRNEVHLLGCWYGVRSRDAAVTNAELTIVSRLMPIFRDHEEFDEEEKCRQLIRALHRRVWWKQSRRNPLNWLVWPIRAYIEFLLGSMTRFTAALLVWLVGLMLAFAATERLAEKADAKRAKMEQVDAVLYAPSTTAPADGRTATLKGTVTEIPDQPSLEPFSHTFSSFFGSNGFGSKHPGWMVLSVIATLSGFLHLGVFISQLYSTIARR